MVKLDKTFFQTQNNFVFLDDIIAQKGMLFTNPIDEIKVYSIKDLKSAFEKIEELKEHYYLAGYIRYEFKDLLLGKDLISCTPLLWFGVFKKPLNIDTIDNTGAFSSFVEIEKQIDFKEYSKAIKKIKNEIELGNTYQVNYTFKNLVKAGCSIENLYLALRENQKTHYAAFIKNEFDTILSFSPELFFEINKNILKTKPMKGTIKKSDSEVQNQKNKEFLANDEKNKAENVMIVDLLRNDMGKISKTSSVKVQKLFEIEEYETLLQMTSTIKSELKDNTSFEDIIKAIFPCGSITGAPKLSTMNIIDKIEASKRGIYCGSIGFISKDKTVMSVPIRTLQKENGSLIYHSGSGITYPSCEKQEWDECDLKMDFLKFNKDFKILETMLLKDNKIVFEKEHLKRMKKSAKFFDIDFELQSFDIEVENDCIVRVLLDRKGDVSYEYLPLIEPKTNKIIISDYKIDSKNTFLKHKTTYRPWYDDSIAKIKDGKVFDEIFLNEKGEICEGARSNILLEINGKMYTPCSSSGLLEGIYREYLLSEGKCQERVLTLSDLEKAGNIYLCNSVRGLVKVELARVSQYNHVNV